MSDDLEVREQRATMFANPRARMPVGKDRAMLTRDDFASMVGPLLDQSSKHERKVMELFDEERRPKIGGAIMRDILAREDADPGQNVGDVAVRADLSRVESQAAAQAHSERLLQIPRSPPPYAHSGCPPPPEKQHTLPSSPCAAAHYLPSSALLQGGGRPEPAHAEDPATFAREASQLARDRVEAHHQSEEKKMHNLLRGQRSQLQFGAHELNPGHSHFHNTTGEVRLEGMWLADGRWAVDAGETRTAQGDHLADHVTALMRDDCRPAGVVMTDDRRLLTDLCRMTDD